MLIRILASAILLFSVLFLPFWASLIIAVGAMIYFDVFWEASVMLFLSDLLFGVKEVKFSSIVFVSSAISVALLIGIEIVKKKLKFYENKK